MRRLVYLAVLAACLGPVASASAETAGEKQVAQNIGSHLKESGLLRNYRVGVKFSEGVAYLNGSVANAEQRDTAVQLAQEIPGVSHVVSKLSFPGSEAETGPIQTASAEDADRSELTAELDRASFEGAQNNSSAVMQAYGSADEAAAVAQMPIARQPLAHGSITQGSMARNPMAQQRRSNMPVPAAAMPGMMPIRQTGGSCPCNGGGAGMAMGGAPGGAMMSGGAPMPAGFVPASYGQGACYDNPQMPGYAWPSYAAYPNYAALSYPQQYSPTAWPYIGPFYPYPQVPLAWRKVSLEWDDGWWFLDFSSHNSSH